MKKVKLYLSYAGHCFANENHAISGGRKMKIKFHALWGLIQHPEKGWILYDTGYTQRFYDSTRKFPNKIYALSTKVIITPQEEIKAQLLGNGIGPNDIKHIIVSHFHADHIGGLSDFPNATFYMSKKALQQALNIPKSIAFSKGVLKDLIPKDIEKRAYIIEDKCLKISDDNFDYKYDLFGDKSIYVYHLPGHAAGQIGIFLETSNRKYFLIADSCWNKKSYEENLLPNPIVRLFFHSWKAYKQTLNRLHLFHLKYPEVIIVPTHCEQTTVNLVQNEFNINVL